MVREQSLLSLIDDIYAAAVDPRLWPRFLTNLMRELNGMVPVLLMHHTGVHASSLLYEVDFDTKSRAAYDEYFGLRNIWLRTGEHLLQPGIVRTNDMMCSREQLLRSEFYNDFLRHVGISHGLGATIVRHHHSTFNLTVCRPPRAPQFDADELAFVALLLPHLQRAYAIHRSLTAIASTASAFGDVLARLSTGVVLLGATGEIVHTNDTAMSVLAAEDGLWVSRRRLEIASPAEETKFRGLVVGVLAGLVTTPTSAGGAMAISRPSGRQALWAVVSPFRQPTLFPSAADVAAIVLLTDPETLPAAPVQQLRSVFGFTEAEALVASNLLNGCTVAEIAVSSAVTEHTVRTHLKRLLAKTGTRRQSELIRLLSALPNATTPRQA